MRIWNEKLIPLLCQKHLCAMWREGLGAYAIITQNKKGYRNHPAVKEFEECSDRLWVRLEKVREEMIKRGYNPKDMPPILKMQGVMINGVYYPNEPKIWQTLDQQIAILKSKGCACMM